MGFCRFFGLEDDFDREYRLVTSDALPSLLLAYLRLAIAVFQISFLVALLTINILKHNGGLWLAYFTNITNVICFLCVLMKICLGAYMSAAAAQGFAYCYSHRMPLQKWPKCLQLAHCILQTTVINFPLLVTLVFWSFLANDLSFATPVDTFSSITAHVLNSTFALFELAFSRTRPPPWTHLIALLVFIALYLGMAYINWASQGWPFYPFLQPNGPVVVGYVFGIGAGVCIIFCITRGLIQLRDWFVQRYTKTPVPLEIDAEVAK